MLAAKNGPSIMRVTKDVPGEVRVPPDRLRRPVGSVLRVLGAPPHPGTARGSPSGPTPRLSPEMTNWYVFGMIWGWFRRMSAEFPASAAEFLGNWNAQCNRVKSNGKSPVHVFIIYYFCVFFVDIGRHFSEVWMWLLTNLAKTFADLKF